MVAAFTIDDSTRKLLVLCQAVVPDARLLIHNGNELSLIVESPLIEMLSGPHTTEEKYIVVSLQNVCVILKAVEKGDVICTIRKDRIVLSDGNIKGSTSRIDEIFYSRPDPQVRVSKKLSGMVLSELLNKASFATIRTPASSFELDFCHAFILCKEEISCCSYSHFCATEAVAAEKNEDASTWEFPVSITLSPFISMLENKEIEMFKTTSTIGIRTENVSIRVPQPVVGSKKEPMLMRDVSGLFEAAESVNKLPITPKEASAASRLVQSVSSIQGRMEASVVLVFYKDGSISCLTDAISDKSGRATILSAKEGVQLYIPEEKIQMRVPQSFLIRALGTVSDDGWLHVPDPGGPLKIETKTQRTVVVTDQ